MKHYRHDRFLIFLVLAISQNAYAYFDPGTGSALIQGLIAAIAAIGVTLKLYWYRIIKSLGFGKHQEQQDSANQEKETET